MCSTAVTFGGGIMITYGRPGRARARGVGREESALFPPGVQRGLDGGWIVLRGERLGHALWSVARGAFRRAWSSSPRTRMLLMTLSMPGAAQRDPAGDGPRGAGRHPAAQLDHPAAEGHHLDGEAGEPRLGAEGGFDRPRRCGRGEAQRARLPEPPGRAAHPGLD